MIDPFDIPEEELALARLASGKLAKVLKGMLSVGLSCLQLDSPLSFLEGRDKFMLALVEVVGHTGVMPGSVTAIELGERTKQLSNLSAAFYGDLAALANWRAMKLEDVLQILRGLSLTYSTLLGALQELLEALGAPADFSRQQQEGREFVDGVETELAQQLQAGAVAGQPGCKEG